MGVDIEEHTDADEVQTTRSFCYPIGERGECGSPDQWVATMGVGNALYQLLNGEGIKTITTINQSLPYSPACRLPRNSKNKLRCWILRSSALSSLLSPLCSFSLLFLLSFLFLLSAHFTSDSFSLLGSLAMQRKRALQSEGEREGSRERYRHCSAISAEHASSLRLDTESILLMTFDTEEAKQRTEHLAAAPMKTISSGTTTVQWVSTATTAPKQWRRRIVA